MRTPIMRLLLLLSAILSALTGVAGPRSAVAQPVAASALLTGQGVRAQAGAVAVVMAFAPASRAREIAVHAFPLPVLWLRPAQPLYADRPRE